MTRDPEIIISNLLSYLFTAKYNLCEGNLLDVIKGLYSIEEIKTSKEIFLSLKIYCKP